MLEKQLQEDGEFHSSGAFTVDATKVRFKLSRKQLEPGDYVVKLVQAAVAAGASAVEVNTFGELTLTTVTPRLDLFPLDILCRLGFV